MKNKLLSLRLWYGLRNPNSQLSLYYQLRNTYKDYRGWASNEFNTMTILTMVLNVAAAPFFTFMPVLTIFVFGTYWCGYIAGHIQQEHTQDRYDLLALLPDGSLAVSWVLSTLHIRNSGIYQYIHDGLRITMLLGGMVLFVLLTGVTIAVIDNRTPLEEGVFPLLNLAIMLAVLLVTLYWQQIQAVVLSQMLGMTIPTLVDERLKSTAWAIVVYLSVQLLTYATALTVSLALLPLVLMDGAFAGTLHMLVISGVLIGTHEALIAILWRRLKAQFGGVDMERLLVQSVVGR